MYPDTNVFFDFFNQSLSQNAKGEYITNLVETDEFEFKQSFRRTHHGIEREYMKDVSGFANNHGGVMIFGIHPDTKVLIGIKPEYQDFDNSLVSSTIGTTLAGNVNVTFRTWFPISNILIGALFIYEAQQKPIIFLSHVENVGKEGDIFYRYSAQTKRILLSNLQEIINAEVNKRVNKVFEKMKMVAQMGVDNMVLLDMLSGDIHTHGKNAKLVLSKDLLQQLNLIPEGRIVQNDAAPAYILKGEIQVEDPTVVERQSIKPLTISDIYNIFFRQICLPDESINILKYLLTLSSYQHPIFFFESQTRMNKSEVIEMLLKFNDPDIKQSTKKKILAKINNPTDPKSPSLGRIFNEIDFSKYIWDDLDERIDFWLIENELKPIQKGKFISSFIASIFKSERKTYPKIIKLYPKETINAIASLEQAYIFQYRIEVLNACKQIHRCVIIPGNCEEPIKNHFRQLICYVDFQLNT